MNRNYYSRRIRVHGEEYIQKQNSTIKPFSVYDTRNIVMSTVTPVMPVGTLIAPLSDPTREFIVQSMAVKKYNEEYQLLPINCRGTLSRFDSSGAKDTFGRATVETATMIYSDVPLYLYSSSDPSDQNTPDRSATKTDYRFSVPTGYSIKPKDRLLIGDSTLTVTAIILTPGLMTTFEALDA